MKKAMITSLLVLSIGILAYQKDKKLRWGILGTSVFSENIVKAIRESSRSEVSAIASRTLKKAQDYAKKHDIPKVYGSYEDLLGDPCIDIIFNPLPNNLHGIWTIKAACAGKHVLCEKPLVTALEDMYAIERAAQENNVIIFEAFAYLHHPQTKKLKELLAAKRIGNIHFINCWFSINLRLLYTL